MRTQKRKRVFAGLLILSLVVSGNVVAKENTIQEEQFGLGYRDVEVEGVCGELYTEEGVPALKGVEIPSAYRSDKVDTNGDGVVDANYLPALRNQGSFGLCWAFSVIGACEASLIRKGIADNSINLSESHMAYYFYNKNETIGDLKGRTIGDYNRSVGEAYYDRGGNGCFSQWHLASWAGPAKESADAEFSYSNMSESLVLDNTSASVYGSEGYHVENVYNLSLSDTASIKQAVMDYGAVTVSYLAVQGSEAAQYDSGYAGKDTGDEGSYYYDVEGAGTNHGVQIVGWDDNYSASKFVKTPKGNGAWLIKNSWGEESSYSAQRGYFWISYYDTSLSDVCQVYDCAGGDNYDNIYQHDGAAGDGSIYAKEAYNVFTAASNELLEAVSIGVKEEGDYTVSVYLFDEDETDYAIENGELVLSQEGHLSGYGYHTVELDDFVYLKQGQSFAVSFVFDEATSLAADYTYQNSNWITFNTAEEEINGFYRYSENGIWSSATEAGRTPRIKAFTKNTNKVIDKVTLSEESITLKKGGEIKLVATVEPENVGEIVEWFSADESVATVSADGTIRAKRDGWTTIIASCYGMRKSCFVMVSDAPVSHYGEVKQLEWSIDENGKFILRGSGDYGYQRPWSSYISEIKSAVFEVEDITSINDMFAYAENLETIDFTGLDTEQVTDIDWMFFGCSSLKELDLSKLNLSKVASGNYFIGSCSSLEKVKLPAGMPVEISLPSKSGYVWMAPSGAVCTTTLAGQATEEEYRKITQTSQYITGVSLDYSEVIMKLGETFPLTCTIDSTSTIVQSDVSWSTNDAGIAVVEDGKVKANGYGETMITVESQNGKRATCRIVVPETLNPILEVEEDSLNLEPGEQKQLTATARGGYTSSVVNWLVPDENVATVSETGLLTAVGCGQTYVLVDYAGVQQMITVTVEYEGIYGDIDENGTINAEDALIILKGAARMLELTEYQKHFGNVDNNESVNAEDALLILKYAAKMIEKFPIEG